MLPPPPKLYNSQRLAQKWQSSLWQCCRHRGKVCRDNVGAPSSHLACLVALVALAVPVTMEHASQGWQEGMNARLHGPLLEFITTE